MSPRAQEAKVFPFVCEPVDPRTRKTMVNPFIHKPMDLPVPRWGIDQGQCKLEGTKNIVDQDKIDELKHYLREYLKMIKRNEQHQSVKPSCHSNLPSELDTGMQSPQPNAPTSLNGCQPLEVSYVQTEFGMVYNCVSRPAKRNRVHLENENAIMPEENPLSPPTKCLKYGQATSNTTNEVQKVAPPAMPLPEQFKYHNWYLKAYQIWVNWHKSTPPV